MPPILRALQRGPRRASGPGRRQAVGARRLRASLDASFAEGATAEVFGACAGGAVLTAWALYLDASPLVIGLLAAFPVAAQIMQVPAAWLTQRVGARPLAIVSIGVSRLVWLPLIAVPFLPVARDTALALFIAVVALAGLCGVVGNNAWTAWMGALVPAPIRGRFFGRRMVFISIAGTVTALGAGLALDAFGARGFKGETLAALTAVACVAGVVSIRLLRAQQGLDRREERPALEWADLVHAARNPAARSLLGYLFGWNAAVGIAAGFFTFHMLTNLEMAFWLVAAHGMVVAAVRVASASAWGRLVDVFGARPVLVVCSFGIAVVPLIWLLVSRERLWPLAVEAVIAGTLWGGHGIAAFDASIGLSPRRGRPFYLAAFATAGGLGFAVSSALAGVLAHVLSTPLLVLGSWWVNIHVLFLLSALGRAVAACIALRIDEPAARPVRELARAVLGTPLRRPAPLPRSAAPQEV
jgi:MFS family permease